jgi:serine protease Do
MKLRLLAAGLLLCLAAGCAGTNKPIDFQGIIENAKAKVYPTLVFVKPIQEQYLSGERQRQEVWGSGVIISPDGYVVTNNHVAEKAIQIHCVLGDKELVEADVIGVDPETDLALLKLKPLTRGVKAASQPASGPAIQPPGRIRPGDANRLSKEEDDEQRSAGEEAFEQHAASRPARPASVQIDEKERAEQEKKLRNLPYAELGDSDQVEAGQFVMALGSPFGFERSISLGIVSNTKRYLGFSSRYQYNLWIQTDAAINPGNSGGPLVNTRGQVIGINTLGVGGAGIGFSVPSNVVKDIVAKIKAAAAQETGAATAPAASRPSGGVPKEPVKVKRAWTGLGLQPLIDLQTTTLTDSKDGVLVQSVDKNSPAEAAGFVSGDILLSVNGRGVLGKYVEDLPPLRVMLSELPVEEPVKMLVRRGGEEVSLQLTPASKGKFEGQDYELRQWNMTVKEITKFSNPQLYFLHPEGGVYIQGVRYPGNARDAGLSHNDIILKIGQADIKTLEDVRKAYEELVKDKDRPEKKVLITIKRGAFREWKTLNWQKDYLQED